MRCKCIQFSPTGLAFAVASTEGLLVYSVDDSLVFDPFELGEDVTPEAADAALASGKARVCQLRRGRGVCLPALSTPQWPH